MSDNVISTLFDLLSKYEVEIPIVQRDYAQGRNDKHSTSVRENLLRDIKTAIEGGGALDLNFIYGKTEKNKFIPLDGQQRLTTLFLVHLYAFANDESKTELLAKFTYETRVSSRKFLKELVKHRASLFASNVKPSDEISDSDWYQQNWDYDPTVKSVEKVLDDIVKILGGINNLPQKLCSPRNEPVKFSLLPMDDLGLEDSIYIRMNARGKMLTPFESYKAQLISRVQRLWDDKVIDINPHDFEHCLDGKWTDLFWSKRRCDFDEAFKNFFDVIFLNYANLPDDQSYISSIEIKDVTAQMVEAAYYTLNYFCCDNSEDEIWCLVSSCLDTQVSFIQRVLFFAISEYMLQTKGNVLQSLNQWIRIICNLTYNTNEQIGRAENFSAAIQSIAGLTPYCDNLLKHFAYDTIDMKIFSPAQVNEERIKANLIIHSPNFATEILSAEKHGYFNGQLRSALVLAGITYEVASNEDDEHLKKRMLAFTEYWSKISALFTSKGPVFGILMRQALLSYQDYTLKTGSYYSFGVDNPNDPVGLKSLFSDSSKTKLIRLLVDNFPSAREEDIEHALHEIINNVSLPETDWRFCFIKYPELFQHMSKQYMRIYKGTHTLIVKNIATNGYNYEVYTYTLSLILRTKGEYPQYFSESGNYGDHYIKSIANGKYVYIRFEQDKFVVYDATVNNFTPDANLFQTNDRPLSEIISYLKINS